MIFRLSVLLLVLLFCGDSVEAGIREIYEKPPTREGWRSVLGRVVDGRAEFGISAALVLGVTYYSEGWTNIEAARADALRVRELLIENGFDVVVTLTDDEVTKEAVEYYMEDYFPDLLGNDGRFFFYYSGHGAQRLLSSGEVRGYLPLTDSVKSRWSSMLSMEDVSDWHRSLKGSRHVLFVLDACFSGLAGVQAKADTDMHRSTFSELSRKGHHLMTAGTADQVSKASMKLWGGSLFTSAFIWRTR